VIVTTKKSKLALVVVLLLVLDSPARTKDEWEDEDEW
jgi:hypothetical protein